MKHIIKLTILLTTFTMVSCDNIPSLNQQSSQPEQPNFIARQSGTPLNPFALNRLAKQTVIEIVSESVLTGGDKYIPIGSGVIIGRKDSTYYVLTANHISDIDDGLSVFIRSEKPGEAGEVLPLKFIRRYPREDLAVVAFASLTDYVVAEVGEASQLDDENQVYVAGWPGNENREGFQFTPAKVTNPRAGDNLNYQPTEPGEDVYKGMSGGAVLNEAGQLVGIHVGLVGGDGDGVLISTFLRMVPPEVEEVLVRGTTESQTVTNTNNATPSQTQDAESYFNQGVEHYDQGEYEKAIAEFNQAIQLNPKFANAYNGRGNVYLNQREYENALADYNQAIRFNPKYAEAYYNWGVVYYNQGEYEKAIAEYNQAIQLNPKLADAYYNRGIVYGNQGEYEKAIAEFNQAIQLNPKDAAAYYHRGLIYKRNRNVEKAISDFEKAADLYKQERDQLWYKNSLDRLKELRGN